MKDINLSQDFSKNGIVKIENILSQKDTDKLHQIVLKNCKSKVEGNNSFPTNYSRLINYIKKPKRLIDSFSILQIYSKYNFLKIANEVTGHNLKISYIDGYVSEKSNDPVLDWHLDQAYSGRKHVKEFLNPDDCAIKFFFYLTDVTKNNGSLAYIPGSHIIAYHLKLMIFNKEIDYRPYWKLEDFRNLIKDPKIFEKLKKKVDLQKIETFLKNTEFLDNKSHSYEKYFWDLSKGSLLIFDEAGAHKGGVPRENDRAVIRFFFRKIKS